MIQDLVREIKVNLANGSKKLIRLGSKLLILVVSCWFVFGAFVLGIGVPAYAMKMFKEPKALVNHTEWQETYPKESQKVPVYSVPVAARGIGNAGGKQVRTVLRQNAPRPDLRSELRDTRHVVTEVRRMSEGFANFARI